MPLHEQTGAPAVESWSPERKVIHRPSLEEGG